MLQRQNLDERCKIHDPARSANESSNEIQEVKENNQINEGCSCAKKSPLSSPDLKVSKLI